MLADFITPPCYASPVFCIGEYYYRFQLSRNHLKIILRWEDYGTGGRLGWCEREELIAISPEIFMMNDLLSQQIIRHTASMMPYKTITEEQVIAQKKQLYVCFEENIKPIFSGCFESN
ncbi:MAG: hypothetical protein IJ389_00340 [Clostridia bacterium]|nr:hypothetical protein [Clostridia bacterium]